MNFCRKVNFLVFLSLLSGAKELNAKNLIRPTGYYPKTGVKSSLKYDLKSELKSELKNRCNLDKTKNAGLIAEMQKCFFSKETDPFEDFVEDLVKLKLKNPDMSVKRFLTAQLGSGLLKQYYTLKKKFDEKFKRLVSESLEEKLDHDLDDKTRNKLEKELEYVKNFSSFPDETYMHLLKKWRKKNKDISFDAAGYSEEKAKNDDAFIIDNVRKVFHHNNAIVPYDWRKYLKNNAEKITKEREEKIKKEKLDPMARLFHHFDKNPDVCESKDETKTLLPQLMNLLMKINPCTLQKLF